jgi:hypothetical protein
MDYTPRRVSNVFLCMVPVLAIALAAPRALRVSGIYQTVGGVLFAAIVIAAWILGARAIRAGAEGDQKLALTGALLLTPFALVALLWVGLGPPWNASPAENVMRYLVLLVSSIAVSGGFVVLTEALSEAGERQYSTLGFAAAMLAGAAYLIWMSLLLGAYIVKVRDGHVPPAINSLIDAFDVLLDVACLLTYLATAAFAVSMGRTGWLGRGVTRAYVAVNIIALLFLVIRGMSFPDPAALSTPWYTQPGFVAGIPAVPFIMPFLLGVVLLRRAGDKLPVGAEKEIPDDKKAPKSPHLRIAVAAGGNRFGLWCDAVRMHWRHSFTQAHAHAPRHRGEEPRLVVPPSRPDHARRSKRKAQAYRYRLSG